MRDDRNAFSIRVLDCAVERGTVQADGLRYALPADLRHRFTEASRVTVVVDSDDIDALLVRDPRSGHLHRAACLSSRATRLHQLMACLDGPSDAGGKAPVQRHLMPAM